MKRSNGDGSKSAAAKRTPPQKKGTASAAANKTPETPKSTPRTTRSKQAAASKAAATPDPKPESKTTVEEVDTAVLAPAEENKPVAVAKSPGKRASAKRTPLAAKAAAAKAKSKPVQVQEEEPAVVDPKEAVVDPKEKEEDKKEEDDKKEDVVETNNKASSVVEDEATNTADDKNKDVAVEEGGEPMEEEPAEKEPMEEEQPQVVAQEESFLEPADQNVEPADEIIGGDAVAEGEEDGVENREQEQDHEGAGVEIDEQMEISDMAEARKTRKEQEIFVGGLDRDATEDDVKKGFEKVGEIVEVRILKDFATNKNKGFAFVKFATKEQAAKALAELKNPMIRGKRCGIAPSEDNDTLFLGNISNTWTKEAIRRKLKDYGVDTVLSITLVLDPQNEGLSRGFTFLEFPCHADAMAAYKRLQKPDVIFGHPERTAKVAFAEPIREPDPEIMAQVKSVFVDGLPPYWDEDRVKEQFKGYGEIERVVLARNMSTARRKDFGFVNFTTHEEALACIKGVNDTELGDGRSKMKARARLANPLPKTQAVKGGMSGGFHIGHSSSGGYSRFGRGFGTGRFHSHRAGFQGGRGFVQRGRGRGRFHFAEEKDFETPYSEFRGGWRPFGPRGGRRISSSSWRERFDRGRGKAFPSRRQAFPPEEDFGGPFGPTHISHDPYSYADGGRGIKRPFSMMEHDPGYLDPGSRMRLRYDHPDPMTGGSRYRDSFGATNLYSRDYYGGSDYGGSGYSSLYGGEPSGSGYYY